ncbi:nucleotide-binding protein 1 [Tribonema minus]|uniref:Cytosolic Fe-S cluster assembly factor NUBP1 homolog n=1 Tax=Tribonema minus TaxID=303371 RepID=A0A835ZEQ2_9STRA|nr:nucleotide-binding protein 1 [Tribonema minus]
MSAVPANANAGCVGPQSDAAGKASACAGCPNQAACASGAAKQTDPSVAQVAARLADVKHTVLVLSGKGGVGKSTMACQLAFALASQGHQVGLLDVDICGPSVPRMLGLTGQEVHQSAAGWSPVYVEDNLGVMSIGFMLPGSDDAVIWRGPRKNGLIKQFLTDVDWGTLDYLVIDTPPGTSDEHISTIQYLKGCNVDGAVIVSTNQEVSLADVRKEINFCKKTSIKVLGVVGNMAALKFPVSQLAFRNAEGGDCTAEAMAALSAHAPHLLSMSVAADVFVAAEGGGAAGMAAKTGVPYLGPVPLDPNLLRACEEGRSFLEAYPMSAAAKPFAAIVDGVLKATGSAPGSWATK